jgi:hypothetical protein
MQFTLLNLAIHEDKQAWLHKQLDEDLLSAGMGDDPETWDYQELFPKLTGPMCVVVGLIYSWDTRFEQW